MFFKDRGKDMNKNLGKTNVNVNININKLYINKLCGWQAGL